MQIRRESMGRLRLFVSAIFDGLALLEFVVAALALVGHYPLELAGRPEWARFSLSVAGLFVLLAVCAQGLAWAAVKFAERFVAMAPEMQPKKGYRGYQGGTPPRLRVRQKARLLRGLLGAGMLALAVALPAAAQEAPAATRSFGGCNRPGTFCAGPSALLSVSAYNLTNGTVVAGFSPGLGYGVTFYPRQWYAAGVDLFVSMQTGPVSGVQVAAVAKFANYIRVGVARQTLGNSRAWLVPVGLGLDLP